MKKNKRIFAFIFMIVILLSVIGLGGKALMDKREEKKEQELLAVEKQSVKVLKNTFADIAEVKIEKSAKNDVTGTYRMFVTLKNTEGESVYFTYGFWKEQNEIGDYGLEDENIQKEGITTNEVRVIYSNGEEEKF